VYGRVGALLEVGTGFHPELTGRENIYLNGAILGMARQEIGRKFDEIVAFAEVDQFIDTPVKHYSSGMGLRLGFAVAAYLEPEILIVDEVLAVGDAAFQKKCIGKMTEVAGGGRTVLFVSHNLPAVQGLCSRVIQLQQGIITAVGDPETIIAQYLQSVTSVNTEQTWEDMESAPGNAAIRLRKVQVRPDNMPPASPITTSTPLVVEIEYWNLKPGARLNLSVRVENSQGYLVFNTASLHEPAWNGKPFPKGLFRSAFEIPGDLLNDGWHKVDVMFVEDVRFTAYVKENALAFDVIDSGIGRGDWYGKWPGVVRPLLNWTTEYLDNKPEAWPSSLPRDEKSSSF
jgi:lipopolysaccharide transport system ATP-binding protein